MLRVRSVFCLLLFMFCGVFTFAGSDFESQYLETKGVSSNELIDSIGDVLPIMFSPLPIAKEIADPPRWGEDMANGILGGYTIGDKSKTGLLTYSYRRNDTDWYVSGLRIFSSKSRISGIVVYYNDSDEEDYLFYAWEILKKKLGQASRLEYGGLAMDVWKTDRYLIGMGFYNEPKYFLFVVDKDQIKEFQKGVSRPLKEKCQ